MNDLIKIQNERREILLEFATQINLISLKPTVGLYKSAILNDGYTLIELLSYLDIAKTYPDKVPEGWNYEECFKYRLNEYKHSGSDKIIDVIRILVGWHIQNIIKWKYNQGFKRFIPKYIETINKSPFEVVLNEIILMDEYFNDHELTFINKKYIREHFNISGITIFMCD